jgi:hypothetical protein
MMRMKVSRTLFVTNVIVGRVQPAVLLLDPESIKFCCLSVSLAVSLRLVTLEKHTRVNSHINGRQGWREAQEVQQC